MKSSAELLDDLYISIGEGREMTDEVAAEIDRLEAIVNPPPPRYEPEEEILYCSPSCNGVGCWDCAAIRGGCPEDV
jgi:hypothetical protein